MVDLAAVLRADTVPIRERDRDELSDVITAVQPNSQTALVTKLVMWCAVRTNTSPAMRR